MRRLIDSANKLHKPWHRQHVTKNMKQDIIWWLKFMEVINGYIPMSDCHPYRVLFASMHAKLRLVHSIRMTLHISSG